MAQSKKLLVALIRGINVGGSSIIKMADLQALFESAGLKDVVTYIQSGNVVFSTHNPDRAQLISQLEEKLTSRFGRPTRLFLLTQAELKQAAAGNPFDPEKNDKEQSAYLMFLSAEPDMQRRQALMALAGQEYRFYIQDKVLYYAYPRELAGKRRTIDFERVLGVSGTARSWKVVDKLIQLLN
jgi:uncharacterized protein (DUF1697 family)